MRSATPPGSGVLYLVPTPIGNPGDITERAVRVLGSVGAVACEDTRNTRTLLGTLGVSARLLSYHEHNEEDRGRQLMGLLRDGVDVAVVSDAGTPLVNDPGFRLVASAIAEDITVRPLPGASAPVTALIGSGLPVHEFHYAGFLPRRAAARQAALTSLRPLPATLLFFEAPHRIIETLRDMHEVLGDRPAALARNLTRDDEEFLRGSLSGLIAGLDDGGTVRGQFTIVVGGHPDVADDADRAMAGLLADAMVRHGVGGRVARDVVRDVTGLPRNWVYDRVRQAEATATAGPRGPVRSD